MNTKDEMGVWAEIRNMESTKFSGMIKIGIDMGKFTQLGISNAYQGEMENCTREDLEKALKDVHSGSFIIKFTKGKITAYSYALTFKAETLNSRIAKHV